MTHFGAIADDFTGATDLAAALARSGVPVSLRLGLPEDEPSDAAAVEVIALKIRTEPVDEAVAAATAALSWLRAAGASRFFWKYCSTFDSTDAGNIGPVSEALMAALGVAQTLYCPSFPENARRVFMGHLFVGHQPLAESPMKDHPLTPMRESDLVRVLTPQVTQPVGLIAHPDVARGEDAIRDAIVRAAEPHLIADAVTVDDLSALAAAVQDWPLLTGGSAIAAHLPQHWMAQGHVSVRAMSDVRTLAGGAIVLSGSCSDMTRRQVRRHAETNLAFRLDPLQPETNGAGAALDWLLSLPQDAAPLIYATSEPEEVRAVQARLGVAEAGALVERMLADVAIGARDSGRARIVSAGGETSGAVAAALGLTRLDVGAEIAPGVPWCFGESAGAPVAITMKSGNFGAETFFADALKALDA